MYYAQDCRALGVAGTKTLQPALLLTVSLEVLLPCGSCSQAVLQSLCFSASASCVAAKCLVHLLMLCSSFEAVPGSNADQAHVWFSHKPPKVLTSTLNT